jgi:hypothetical protein
MAKLKSTDQLKLEKLFEMSGGYILDFTNAIFQQFIWKNAGMDIYSPKYETYGDSKAKRLRAFWDIENDQIVGKIITELIEYWRTSKILSESEITEPQEILSRGCKEIADRLLGKKANNSSASASKKSESDFLQQNLGEVSLKELNLESGLVDVLNQRIKEIQKCLKGRASLAVIFLCGSTLEGILLGVATRNPQVFNQAKACPKDKSTGKVLAFHLWSLNDLINVSHEIGVLGLDVKRFSHALRDFRNYIHPYEQWRSDFSPDEHTALICWQVLKAAIHDLR